MTLSICLECNRVFETQRKTWLKDFCDDCLREIKREEQELWDEHEDCWDWEYHCRQDERGEE